MTRLVVFILTIAITAVPVNVIAQSGRALGPASYYPLAKGNKWRYQVKRAGEKGISTTEWRVTRA